jgi:peroxiredoxin
MGVVDWVGRIRNRASGGLVVLSFLLVIGISSLGTGPARANEGKADIGPATGTSLGHVIAFRDETGASRSFASLTGKNGMILVFSRSLSWCPYCKADAREWSDLSGEANALGMGVAVATYDSIDVLEAFSRNRHIKITLLSDEGSRVIRALGILNKEHGPGSFAHGIPHPMVLIMDASGILRHRFSEEHYSERADKSAVLAAAATLSGN